MGYVPKDARWFVAELVVEIKVDEDLRNVVHVNMVLVNADSAEDAYARALELGATYGSVGVNEAGHAIVTTFLGLRDLWVMHDVPAHGAEVIFEEKVGVERKELQALITSKSELTIFTTWQPPSDETPDYASGWIVREMRKETDVN